MKNISSLLLLAAVALLIPACSKKKEVSDKPVEVVEQQNNQLTDALSEGNLGSVSALADSMSLYVDDLTPEETISVLMAFLEVHNQSVQDKDRRRDLETLRKFVDVYDIAVSVNPRDMKKAFEKARSINPAVNLDSLAIEFRSRLTEYDAIRGGELVAPVKRDTVTSEPVSTAPDVPVELRPAE